jgi:hypothetical protein
MTLIASRQANDTQPLWKSGWVSEPLERGTFTILRSCIVTLFLCIYSAQHFNLPGPDGHQTRKRRFGTIMLALLAPEMAVSVALEQLYRAVHFRRQMRARGFTEWSLEQSFFIIMGGLWGHCSNVERPFVILPAGVLRLVDRGIITVEDPGPILSTRQIRDRSKVDTVGRVVTILQVSWMVLQVVGRLAAGLPLATLEIVTCAYIACALVTYAAWWKKPKDIEVPNEMEVPAELVNMNESLKPDSLEDPRPWEHAEASMQGGTNGMGWSVAPGHIVVKGIQAGAWRNSQFPTEVEVKLWRALILVSVGMVLVGLIPQECMCLLRRLSKTLDRAVKDFARKHKGLLDDNSPSLVIICVAGLFWFFVILAAQCMLLVLAFLTLRTMPAAVYHTVQWSMYIPHI